MNKLNCACGKCYEKNELKKCKCGHREQLHSDIGCWGETCECKEFKNLEEGK